MLRISIPRQKRTACVAVLSAILLIPSNLMAQATVKPKTTYPPQEIQDDPPDTTTTTTGKITDASCESGKRWVIYTYTDGKLTDTEYDDCV